MTTVAERIRELSMVPKGWLDGEGEAIKPVILRLAQETLEALERQEIKRGGIYPTPDGRIQVEWDRPHKSVECVFYEDEAICYVYGDTEPEDEYHLSYEVAVEFLQKVLKC